MYSNKVDLQTNYALIFRSLNTERIAQALFILTRQFYDFGRKRKVGEKKRKEECCEKKPQIRTLFRGIVEFIIIMAVQKCVNESLLHIVIGNIMSFGS